MTFYQFTRGPLQFYAVKLTFLQRPKPARVDVLVGSAPPYSRQMYRRNTHTPQVAGNLSLFLMTETVKIAVLSPDPNAAPRSPNIAGPTE